MGVQQMFHVKHWQQRLGGLRAAGLAATALIAAGVLSACSAPEEIARKAGVAATPAAAAQGQKAPAIAPAPAKAEVFADNAEDAENKGRMREFSYQWPAAVSAIPALAARLAQERDSALAEQQQNWADLLSEADNEECAACYSLSFSKEWKVVADLPRFLSLSAEIYLFTGGAHGNSGFDALVWDREAQAALEPEALFLSPAALQEALGPRWCRALAAERKRRLGADYGDDGFFPCPPIADLSVLLGSSDGKAFNRIGLIAAPYVAGSYAEGPYEVTLPVTDAVVKAVKPQYRSAFARGA
ncbi:MAG: hypothetical protein KatS3mg120_0632 [Erythrobacter sp.]|nr:MAG: hypothetical protein KatS3mg120_0632 [Erythrobacter sp.]